MVAQVRFLRARHCALAVACRDRFPRASVGRRSTLEPNLTLGTLVAERTAPGFSMRVFAEVAQLLGDGDNTEANDGTFENVLLQTGPDITECKPGQVVVDVKAACINYPDLLQTVVRVVHLVRYATAS